MGQCELKRKRRGSGGGEGVGQEQEPPKVCASYHANKNLSRLKEILGAINSA